MLPDRGSLESDWESSPYRYPHHEGMMYDEKCCQEEASDEEGLVTRDSCLLGSYT